MCVRVRVCLRFRYKLQTEVSDAFRVSDATSSTTLFFSDNEGRKIVHKSVKDLIALNLSDLRSLRKQNLNFFVR